MATEPGAVLFRPLSPRTVVVAAGTVALASVLMAAAGIYGGAAVLFAFGSLMTLWALRTYVVLHEDEVEVVNLRRSSYAYRDIERAEARARRYSVTELDLREGKTVTLGPSVGFAEELADGINQRLPGAKAGGSA